MIDKSSPNQAGFRPMTETLEAKDLNNIIEHDHRFIKKTTSDTAGHRSCRRVAQKNSQDNMTSHPSIKLRPSLDESVQNSDPVCAISIFAEPNDTLPIWFTLPN
ncbi:MAG: hypothetical protein GDA50_08960 [Alphaproteobacteria bacterium GM202ARS2]|nr:hypothetical protein [Alphaproteobacteria bacterium GM202ARS2]